MENGARASVHGHDGRRSPKRRWQEPEKEPEREKVKERKRPRWRCRRGKSPAEHGTPGAAPHTWPRPCLPTGPFWLLAPSGVLRRQCMLRTVPYSLLDITTVTALPTSRCTCTQHALTTAQSRGQARPGPDPHAAPDRQPYSAIACAPAKPVSRRLFRSALQAPVSIIYTSPGTVDTRSIDLLTVVQRFADASASQPSPSAGLTPSGCPALVIV